MAVCVSCGKKPNQRSWSRHKKGSSGHGGFWNLKAPISKRSQKPNLHAFRGKKYCTKCLRITKEVFKKQSTAKLVHLQAHPSGSQQSG